MSASINVNITNVIFKKSYLFEALKQKFKSVVNSNTILRTASQNQTFCNESNLVLDESDKIQPLNNKFELEFRRCRRYIILSNARLSCISSPIFKHRGYFCNQPNVFYISQIRNIHSTRVSFHEDRARECWKCGRQMVDPAELFYCKCGIVQKPASNLTYFQLFGLSENFDIDLRPLSEKYIELQKQLHPDKFSQASETEKSHAADQSSLVNKAYSVLTKPLHRAIYMLQLHDNPIEESSAISDPEFLLEIMEMNEELAEVDSPEELKIIEEQNESNIEKSHQEITEAFKSKNIQTAHELVVKLQYYSNISDKIKELKRSWIK